MKKLLNPIKCTLIFLTLILCFMLISCQKGENGTTVESSKSKDNNTYTINHEKNSSTYKVSVADGADAGSILCLYNIQTNELLQSVPIGQIPGGVAFEDVNSDGYMDVVTNTGGTLNETHELYIWNVSSRGFIKVAFDKFEILSYFEVRGDYIENWVKDTASSGIIQKLVWSENTLVRVSQEQYN